MRLFSMSDTKSVNKTQNCDDYLLKGDNKIYIKSK